MKLQDSYVVYPTRILRILFLNNISARKNLGFLEVISFSGFSGCKKF